MSSVPGQLPKTDAERIQRLERILAAVREGETGGDDFDVVALVKAIGELGDNGSTKSKVGWLVGAFAICAVVGSYLAVKVVTQGEELAAIKAEVSRCVKIP